jgi:pimeloyl-ACP methyl ester carboxylesterase
MILLILLATLAEVRASIVLRSINTNERGGLNTNIPTSCRCRESFSTPTTIMATSSKDESAALSDGLYCLGDSRCYFLKAKNVQHKEMYPPLILLGGMAQSIDSWQVHLPSLSKDRHVLIVACTWKSRCDDDSKQQLNVTLPRQAELVHQAILHFFSSPYNKAVSKVDIVGFSLGGRIAMAFVTLFPSMVRKVHLTGVAAERDEYARVILQSWMDILQPDLKIEEDGNDARAENHTRVLENDHNVQLRSFAWSILMNTYSEEFVSIQGLDRIQQKWIPAIMEYNSVHCLYALLQQTREEDLWHPTAMAQRIASLSSQYDMDIRLHVGALDKLATVHQVRRLRSMLDKCHFSKDVVVYANSGHAVWLEKARPWRNDLLEFLNSSPSSF